MTEEMAIYDETVNAPVGVGKVAISCVQNTGLYATFEIETMQGKKRLFSITRNSESLKDHMNKAIKLSDIAFSTVTVTNEETGEQSAQLAVYLIDDKGNSYMSSSKGVCNSAIELLNVFGAPVSWDEPISVVCKEKNTTRGNRYKYLSVE